MEDKNIVHSFDGKGGNEKAHANQKFFTNGVLTVLIVAAVAGIGTGFIASAAKQKISPIPKQSNPVSASSVKSGDTYGTADEKTFKDSAEGIMTEGGIDGEGAYHLVRPGGDSQNVYLTSSVIDLSLFVGKKVKVWGQTNAAQKAGWLMDVGKLTVL